MSLLVMSYIVYDGETWTDNEEERVRGSDDQREGRVEEREGIRGSAIREENNGNDGS
jgi:uncharacterized protein YjbJ (UPF0337 family)